MQTKTRTLDYHLLHLRCKSCCDEASHTRPRGSSFFFFFRLLVLRCWLAQTVPLTDQRLAIKDANVFHIKFNNGSFSWHYLVNLGSEVSTDVRFFRGILIKDMLVPWNQSLAVVQLRLWSMLFTAPIVKMSAFIIGAVVLTLFAEI